MESAQKRRARSLDLALLSLARQNSNTVQILSEDMTIPQSSLIGPTALCFVLLLGISNAQPRPAPPMKVKLSVSTFDPASLREFQSLADEISAIIDEMIPGVPADYPADGIVCFEAPSRWTADAYKANGFSPPPLTFTGPKVYDEPDVTLPGGRIRNRVVSVLTTDGSSLFNFHMKNLRMQNGAENRQLPR